MKGCSSHSDWLVPLALYSSGLLRAYVPQAFHVTFRSEFEGVTSYAFTSADRQLATSDVPEYICS